MDILKITKKNLNSQGAYPLISFRSLFDFIRVILYNHQHMKKSATYRSAGVDIDEGERFVRLIKPLAKKTARKGVIGSLGGFGALFSARFATLKDPVLVSGTDGVGTKLKIAFLTDTHDTIGIDLVAMCVNDIVVSGAEPLFFLDYLSTGKLKAEGARDIVKGIAKGCKDAGCALIGGETAEMPGMYSKGEYDLAGFAVGVVDRGKIIDGKLVRSGDAVIGLASSGLHSNGFSLARKVLFETMKLAPSAKPKGFRRTIAKELLTPTRIYVKPLLKIIKKFDVHAMAHITGGGLTGNIPRVLPKGLKAVVQKGSWPVPPIFNLIKEGGNVAPEEMMRTFNAGIGMVVIVKNKDKAKVITTLNKDNIKAFEIGEIVKGRSKTSSPKVEFI